MREQWLAVRYAVLACLTHLAFIALCSLPGLRAVPLVTGDAVTFAMDAQNLLLHGAFSRESAPPFLWEPYRTPGYPLLIAASLALAGSEGATLFIAALTAGLAAWSAVRLVQEWGGNSLAQHVAGMVVAFFPNSLGLSALLLTDAIFGHLFLFWFYLLYIGLERLSLGHLSTATGVLWVLQTLKPTLNVAVVLIAGMVVIMYPLTFPLPEGERNRARGVGILLMMAALVLPFYFAGRNWEDNGVFSPTLLGVETAREYLQVRYLSEQSGADLARVTEEVRAADLAAAMERSLPASLYGRLYRVKEDAVNAFIWQDPWAALRLMAAEMAQQALAPQEFAVTVFWADPPDWVRAIGSLLTLVLWAGAALGMYCLARQGRWQPAAACTGVFIFFLVAGSVSHLVGARLRFPADMVAIPLLATGVVHSVGMWTSRA